METISLNASSATESCAVCNQAVTEADSFCNHCGYPLKGTETEQNNFISERNAREIDLEESQKAVRIASRTLYVLAALTVAMGVIMYFISKGKDAADGSANAYLVVNVVLAVIYLALALWSKKKPVAALISGLSLYIILQVLDAIASPITLAQGIVLKIIYIGYFIKGIKSAMEAERIKKQYNL